MIPHKKLAVAGIFVNLTYNLVDTLSGAVKAVAAGVAHVGPARPASMLELSKKAREHFQALGMN